MDAQQQKPEQQKVKHDRIILYEVEARAKQKIEDQQLQLSMKMNRLGGKVVEMKKSVQELWRKTILKGFDYTFKKGEQVGIVGKTAPVNLPLSTSFKGIQEADSGKINIGDTVIFSNYSQKGYIKEDMQKSLNL